MIVLGEDSSMMEQKVGLPKQFQGTYGRNNLSNTEALPLFP